MASDSFKTVLTVSVADVSEWRADIARLKNEVEERQKQIQALENKVKAVELLAGPFAVTVALGAPHMLEDIAQNTTLKNAIKIALSAQQEGRTPAELVSLLKQTPVAPKVIKSPGAIYTAIKSLVEGDEVIQHGKLLYDPNMFSMVARGIVHDARYAIANDLEPAFRTVILTTLKLAGRPLSAGEIRDRIADIPTYGERAKRRPNYVYNTLLRMMESEQVKKIENRYYPADAETPSTVTAEGVLL